MAKRGVAVLVVVAVFLVGCGSATASDRSDAVARGRITAAVGRTEASGSAHLVTVSDTSGTASAGSPTSGVATHLLSEGDIRFAGPDLALTTTVRSGGAAASPPTTAVYVGRHLYLSAGPGPDAWVRATYRRPYPYLGAVQASALATTTGPVRTAGSGRVDGEPATRYLVQMPGSSDTIALTNSRNQPYDAQLHIAPFVLTVWLDRAGRIVRTQATQTVTYSRSTRVVVERSETTLSDFGEPVEISAPSTSVKA
jgi:hypothetical protein